MPMTEYSNGWFFSDLCTKVVEKGQFELIDDFYVQWGKFAYVVCKGERIDFASIPVGLRSIFNRLGSSRLPAAMHDSMYANKYATRARCDELFYEALKGVGMPTWKAWIYYAGVRMGGWTRGSW